MSGAKRRIAIIPARGGSKRLPGKNIVDFMGKPIIAWSIEAALQSKLFKKVVVSTDDDDIAAVSKKYGAEIEARAKNLAVDTASITDVCLDYAARHQEFDTLCCLYATAPMRTSQDIVSANALLEPGVCDFVTAATHYDLPAHQALWKHKDGTLEPLRPDLINKQSTDIGEIVVDNGSVHLIHIKPFLNERTFFGKNLRVYVMPRERSQDIDEAIDLELARFFAQKNMGRAA